MASEGLLGRLHRLCSFQAQHVHAKCRFMEGVRGFVRDLDHTLCGGALAILLALFCLLGRSKEKDFFQLRFE